MIQHKCRVSWCVEYLAEPGYCPAHTRVQEKVKAFRDSEYDRRNRDVDMKRFYNSAVWRTVRAMFLAEYPLCNKCREKPATVVHHTTPAKTLAPAERVNRRHFEGLCTSCHSIEESQVGTDAYRYVDPYVELARRPDADREDLTERQPRGAG